MIAAISAALLLALWALPDTSTDSDLALIDIQILNTLDGWQPHGAYSRGYAHHPGPLYFQLLAPFYFLSGYKHSSVVLMVSLMNGVSLGCLLWLMRRGAGSYAHLGALAAITVVFLLRFNGLVTSSWNPHVALLPFMLTPLLAAYATSRSTAALPWLAAVSSFCIQAHFSYAAPLAGVWVCTVVLLWRRTRNGILPGPLLRRHLLLTIGVVGVLWAVPVIDEIRKAGEGNLSTLIAFLGAMPAHDPMQAARAFEHLIVAPLTPGMALWSTPLPSGGSQVTALVWAQVVMCVACAFYSLYRRRRFEADLFASLLLAAAFGLVAVRGGPEPLQLHIGIWAVGLGCLIWTLIVGGVLSVGQSRNEERAHRRFSRVDVVVVLPIIAICGYQFVLQMQQDRIRTTRVRTLSDAVLASIRDSPQERPHFRFPEDWGVMTGVVLEVDRNGRNPTVEANRLSMFGDRFAAVREPVVVFDFADVETHFEDKRYRTDYALVASAGPMFMYRVSAPPTSRVARNPTIVDRSADVSDPETLLVPVVKGRGASGATVTFSTPADYVTVAALPAEFAGVRLTGQQGSYWQIRCDRGTGFDRVGRIKIDRPGPEAATGEGYLRGLSSCRQLKIALVPDSRSAWLSSVELLAGGEPSAEKGR